jgi:hypothetical protein
MYSLSGKIKKTINVPNGMHVNRISSNPKDQMSQSNNENNQLRLVDQHDANNKALPLNHAQKSYLDMPSAMTNLNITIMSHLETKKYELINYHRKLQAKVKRILITCLLAIFVVNSHFLLFIRIQVEVNTGNDNNMWHDISFISFTNNETAKKGLLVKNQNYYYYNNKKLSDDILSMSKCGAQTNSFYSYFLDHIWFFIDMFVYFCASVIVMFICFAFVYIKMRKVNKKYAELMATKSNKTNKRIWQRKMQRNKRIIRRLAIKYVYFVLSILPYFLFNIFNSDRTRNYEFIETLLLILFYSNNSLNFFFYGLTCQTFRQELLRILVK